MADFNFVSHKIEVGTPRYNVAKTKMVGMRKKARLLSSEPDRSWTLYIFGLTKSDRDLILAHYQGQNGNCIPFYWTSVPDYVDTAASYYVTYAEDGYSERIVNGIFEVTVKFELQL